MKNSILAWRNLWRNRRRTLITAASVLFAVFFALLFRSLQLGSYDHMFRNVIESYSGYIQVQEDDFWEEKTVENTFVLDTGTEKEILEDPNVRTTIPRFESFALASNGPRTKGVLVMGVDPVKEEHLSKIREKKVAYRLTPGAIEQIRSDPSIPEKVKELAKEHEEEAFTTASRLQLDLGIGDRDAGELMPVIREYTRFENGEIHIGEPGALIGESLAGYMELGIGDTLVLIGQGYHATTAAGKYEIKGIVKLPLPDIDNKIVYLPLEVAQQLYNAPGRMTSLALAVEENGNKSIRATVERMEGTVGEGLRVLEWKEMNELIVSQMDADNKSGMIMIGILYLVIAFGIFGTVLMLTAERKREFGVLVAIGMQKRKLASVVTLEMLFIGLLGILAGSLIGAAIILYGVENPIVFKGEMARYFEEYGMEPKMVFEGIGLYFAWQAVIVALMVGIAIGYPLRKIFRMKVVNALRT